MFKQTIRFERAQDAIDFDQHVIDFLRMCDQGAEDAANDACLFTVSLREDFTHVRVVQTDSAHLLDRLLAFLTLRDFPPPVEYAAAPRAVSV
ncbi:hypothetical protein [Maricaulis alexandrii]|jgi:hypothetical protein|uniref:hypothetical protein n=1 Tax=Maricaulis alexandrii TaxID=2570354 RepID=UPI001108D589|nr:hypothetical protein [Maricaulis alexandrii]